MDKNWTEVLEYAGSIRDGKKIACKELKQAVDRFFRDLDNPDYEIDHTGPAFCIGIIESTICHQQGERIDGTPLRGEPFLLLPFHKFIIYNLIGFKLAGTNIVRFHEALIFIPRKNIKTSFAASLAWALSLWYRKSGSKTYITAAALMQSLESFNFLSYNVRRMGEDQKTGGHVHIIDNNNEHSLEATLADGSFFIRALAANPDAQDSLNCTEQSDGSRTCTGDAEGGTYTLTFAPDGTLTAFEMPGQPLSVTFTEYTAGTLPAETSASESTATTAATSASASESVTGA